MCSLKAAPVVLFLSFFTLIIVFLLQRDIDMDSETHIHSIQDTIVGGWQERNPNENEIQDLLLKALSEVNEQSNDEYYLMPIKLLSASSQVVSGVRYNLEIQLARSEHKKSSTEKVNLKTCKRLEGHPDQILKLDIWDKPWENFFQVKILETKVL